MPLKKLFPTLLYTAHLGPAKARELNKDLLSDIKTLSNIDRPGIHWSKKNYIGGYTSYGSVTDLHYRFSTFTDLKTHIDRHVKKFIHAAEWDLMGRKIQMTTCWASIMPKHTYHTLHIHPLSVISGTYYVSVNSKSSALKIEDTRMEKLMNSPPRRSNSSLENKPYISIAPENGKLILFESWVRHEVPPNTDKADRVSVSFNYEWV